MATSSFFTNVKITDPKFIKAWIASVYESKVELSASIIPAITDLNEIRKIMAKRLKDNDIVQSCTEPRGETV